jgi:hypothetical protein
LFYLALLLLLYKGEILSDGSALAKVEKEKYGDDIMPKQQLYDFP